jgi:multimeric flavodoxin WrbA
VNIKDNFKETAALAASVGMVVPLWGTFHANIGITLAWPAFVSAALFFAMGHRVKDAPGVIVGNLLGVGWGLLFFNLLAVLSSAGWPSLSVPLATLGLLGLAAVLITHLGISMLSHLPSLFSGWAVAVGVLGAIQSQDYLSMALDAGLSLVAGVLALGVGIPALNQLFLRNKPTTSKQAGKKTDKPTPAKSVHGSSKLQSFIAPYRNQDSENEVQDEKDEYSENLAEIKSEIIKLSNYFPKAGKTGSGAVSEIPVSIVGVCGSPHKKGSTIQYLQKVLEASESMGNVKTELITIAGKDIRPCMGCKTDKCYGECKIKDDMQEIYPFLRNADGIVIASPSYFGTFSGQLKMLIDRLRVLRHTDFQLANKVIAPLAVAGRRHGGQEITNLDIIQAMMRHNTIIVNDGTAVCQLGATGWSHTFDDPNSTVDDDAYGLQTCEGVGYKIVEISRAIKSSGVAQQKYQYNAKIGKR